MSDVEAYWGKLVEEGNTQWRASKEKHTKGYKMTMFGRVILVKLRISISSASYTLTDINLSKNVVGKAWSRPEARDQAIRKFILMAMASKLPLTIPENLPKPPESGFKNLIQTPQKASPRENAPSQPKPARIKQPIAKVQDPPIKNTSSKSETARIKQPIAEVKEQPKYDITQSVIKGKDETETTRKPTSVHKLEKGDLSFMAVAAVLCLLGFLVLSFACSGSSLVDYSSSSREPDSSDIQKDLATHTTYQNISNKNILLTEITITRSHIVELARRNLIHVEQIDLIWDALHCDKPTKEIFLEPDEASFSFLTIDNIFYVLGTLFVMGAFTFFMNSAFEKLIGEKGLAGFLFVVIVLIIICAINVDYYFDHYIIGGLLYSIAIGLGPLTFIQLQKLLGKWTRPTEEPFMVSLGTSGSHLIIVEVFCLVTSFAGALIIMRAQMISLFGWLSLHLLFRDISVSLNNSDSKNNLRFCKRMLLLCLILICLAYVSSVKFFPDSFIVDFFWWGKVGNFMAHWIISVCNYNYDQPQPSSNSDFVIGMFFSGICAIDLGVANTFVVVLIPIIYSFSMLKGGARTKLQNIGRFSIALLIFGSVVPLFRLIDPNFLLQSYGSSASVFKLFGLLGCGIILIPLGNVALYDSISSKFLAVEAFIIDVLFVIGLLISTDVTAALPQLLLMVLLQLRTRRQYENQSPDIELQCMTPLRSALYTSFILSLPISVFTHYLGLEFDDFIRNAQIFAGFSLLFALCTRQRLWGFNKEMTILWDVSGVSIMLSTGLQSSNGIALGICCMLLHVTYKRVLHNASTKTRAELCKEIANNFLVYGAGFLVFNFALWTVKNLFSGIWLIDVRFTNSCALVGFFSLWVACTLRYLDYYKLQSLEKQLKFPFIMECSSGTSLGLLFLQVLFYGLGIILQFDLLVSCATVGLFVCCLGSISICYKQGGSVHALPTVIVASMALIGCLWSTISFSIMNLSMITQGLSVIANFLSLGVLSTACFPLISPQKLLLVCLYYGIIGLITLAFSLGGELFVLRGNLLLLSGIAILYWCYFVLWLVRCWAKPTSRFSLFTKRRGNPDLTTRMFAKILSNFIAASLILFSNTFNSFIMYWSGFIAMVLLQLNLDGIRVAFLYSLVASLLFIFVGAMIQSLFIVICGALALLCCVGDFFWMKYRKLNYLPLLFVALGVLLFILGLQYSFIAAKLSAILGTTSISIFTRSYEKEFQYIIRHLLSHLVDFKERFIVL